MVVALFLRVNGFSSHREVHIYMAVLYSISPYAFWCRSRWARYHLELPVVLVTLPLSNNGAKMVAQFNFSNSNSNSNKALQHSKTKQAIEILGSETMQC